MGLGCLGGGGWGVGGIARKKGCPRGVWGGVADGLVVGCFPRQGMTAEALAPWVCSPTRRSRDGSVVSYPVVETIHRDSICHVTEAPADVPDKVWGPCLFHMGALPGIGWRRVWKV